MIENIIYNSVAFASSSRYCKFQNLWWSQQISALILTHRTMPQITWLSFQLFYLLF